MPSVSEACPCWSVVCYSVSSDLGDKRVLLDPVSRFYAFVEACKGRRSSGCREPLSEVELTRCQAKRICALVNLKNLVSPLILLGNMSF